MIFSPALIHDFRGLKRLFTGQGELQQMEQFSNEELARPADYLYYNRWEVALITLSSPLILITYLFLEVAAIALCSNQIELLAKRVFRPIFYYNNQEKFGSSLWMPTDEEPQADLADLYDLPSVRRDEIKDPFIQAHLHRLLGKVNFNRIGKGYCWGSCQWFNYLLLKKMKSQPLEKAVVAVAKLFEDGTPRQAILLQAFYGLESHLLDMESFQLNKKIDRDGIYVIGSKNHAISYVRGGGKEFIFDPRDGLIVLSSPRDLSSIFEDDGPFSLALQSLKETR